MHHVYFKGEAFPGTMGIRRWNPMRGKECGSPAIFESATDCVPNRGLFQVADQVWEVWETDGHGCFEKRLFDQATIQEVVGWLVVIFLLMTFDYFWIFLVHLWMSWMPWMHPPMRCMSQDVRYQFAPVDAGLDLPEVHQLRNVWNGCRYQFYELVDFPSIELSLNCVHNITWYN